MQKLQQNQADFIASKIGRPGEKDQSLFNFGKGAVVVASGMKVSNECIISLQATKDYLGDYHGRIDDSYKVTSMVGGSLIDSKSQKRANSSTRIGQSHLSTFDKKLQNYRGSSLNKLGYNQNTSTFGGGDLTKMDRVNQSLATDVGNIPIKSKVINHALYTVSGSLGRTNISVSLNPVTV